MYKNSIKESYALSKTSNHDTLFIAVIHARVKITYQEKEETNNL